MGARDVVVHFREQQSKTLQERVRTVVQALKKNQPSLSEDEMCKRTRAKLLKEYGIAVMHVEIIRKMLDYYIPKCVSAQEATVKEEDHIENMTPAQLKAYARSMKRQNAEMMGTAAKMSQHFCDLFDIVNSYTKEVNELKSHMLAHIKAEMESVSHSQAVSMTHKREAAKRES